jgi:hypothetical protein
MKLRFSIRDLFWLTAIAAMGLAWWLDHRRSMALHEKYQSNIRIILPHLVRGGPYAKLDFGSDEFINFYADSISKAEQKSSPAEPFRDPLFPVPD